jgi:hypothetical protein
VAFASHPGPARDPEFCEVRSNKRRQPPGAFLGGEGPEAIASRILLIACFPKKFFENDDLAPLMKQLSFKTIDAWREDAVVQAVMPPPVNSLVDEITARQLKERFSKVIELQTEPSILL